MLTSSFFSQKIESIQKIFVEHLHPIVEGGGYLWMAG